MKSLPVVFKSADFAPVLYAVIGTWNEADVIEATVNARNSGYIVSWSKDIGAPVKKGDLLAQIAAPEIDQQLNQAEATRAEIESRRADRPLSRRAGIPWRRTATCRTRLQIRPVAR